jgi:hypothetical protein
VDRADRQRHVGRQSGARVDTDAVLDLLDVDAAESALAAAEPLSLVDPARPAALLSALLRQRPLRHGNELVALVATAQFMALNGVYGRSRPAGSGQVGG